MHFVAKCNTQTDQLDENVKRMWDLETIGVMKISNLTGVDVQLNCHGETDTKTCLVIMN